MPGVSIQDPTPEEARAALAEVCAAERAVRSSDRVFQTRLLAFAGATIGLMLVLVVVGSLPNWLAPVAGFIVPAAFAAIAVAVISLQMRQRAYSPTGNRIFVVTVLVWLVWGLAVMQFSAHSGWWVPQPRLQRGWHFLVSALVGVVPLLVGAWLLGRRR